MSVTLDNYLNILGILINEVFGSVVLFILIGLIVITYICVKNDIPLYPTIAVNAIFGLLTLTIYYDVLILGIIVIVLGLIIVLVYNNFLREQNN